MNTSAYIQSLTRLNTKEQEQLSKYYGGLPAAIRSKAHDRQRQLVRSWANNCRAGQLSVQFPYDKERGGDNGYAALLEALAEIRTAEQCIVKGRNVDAATLALNAQVRQARAANTDVKRVSSPKADLVRENMRLIMGLRTQAKPMSWRLIAELAIFKKRKMTGARVQQVYAEVLAEQDLTIYEGIVNAEDREPKAAVKALQLNLFQEAEADQ